MGRSRTLVLVAAAAWVGRAALALPPADLALELVTAGLERPLAAVAAGDGSGRLFVVEQPGRVRIWKPGVGLLATPFLDLTTLVGSTTGERGLLGMVFDPAYATTGFLYVSYTRAADGASVLARYAVSAGDPDVADPTTAHTLLVVPQPASNHNGGDLHFDATGRLVWGIGDGGGGGDPDERAQDLTFLLGKLLRLDPDGDDFPADPARNYAIPADNPFVGGFGEDEIWAFGLRNPWRWSFDRATGDLWIADVGQGSREEVSFQPAGSAGGENYGWDCYEGSIPFPSPDASVCSGPLVFPVLEYSSADDANENPTGRCSVTGGFVYRGHRIAGLRGIYVFGDFCTGEVLFGTRDGGSWALSLWHNTPYSVASFGEDEAGELLLLHRGAAGQANGAVYRFVSPSSIFADDFESADTAAWSAAVPPGS